MTRDNKVLDNEFSKRELKNRLMTLLPMRDCMNRLERNPECNCNAPLYIVMVK